MAILLYGSRVSPYAQSLQQVGADQLIGFWKLEEDGTAQRVDATGRGNNLSHANTPTAVVGKIGLANAFALASQEQLTLNSNADVTATGDFTLAGFFWLNNKDNIRYFITKDTGVAPFREFDFQYTASNDLLEFTIFSAAGASKAVSGTTFGSPTTGQWHHFIIWHDTTADTVNMQINGGSVDSVATANLTVPAGSGSFRMAHRQGASSAHFLDGRLDASGYWKRVLTPAEREYLYFNGNGREYPFT